MQPGQRGKSVRTAPWLRSYRAVRLSAVSIAALLVVVVVVAVVVPPAQNWVRSWWGSATLALLMLVGYGAAAGALGASPAINARTRIGRRLPAVIAMAPIAFVLMVGDPVHTGTVAAGLGAWAAMVLGLLVLRATSGQRVPWHLRAAALGAPSWLLASVGCLFLAVSGSPELVSTWLLPVQVCLVIAGVVAVPAILVVESVSALSGEGWIGRWLAPETDRRAWAALVVKGAATSALILILSSQGTVLAGWWQAGIVALLVLLILMFETVVPFSDLRRGQGLARQLRISVTSAMAAMGVLFGGYVLLLAFQRPLTLVGLVLVSSAAMFVPAPIARRRGRIIWVAAAGVLAAWAWAAGPTIGTAPAVDLAGWSVPTIIAVFVATVLTQVVLALRARQWGFPVLVFAIAAGLLTQSLTHESAGVVPVNLLVLPALALAMFLGRSSRGRVIDAGEVIRWSVVSLIAIDLTAAASLASGDLQAGVLALTLLTLGLAPLVLNGRGSPRIRAAGLVCAIFTAFIAMLGAVARLPGSPGILELLDSLNSAFFWVIAFPVSAALSAASARLDPDLSPADG